VRALPLAAALLLAAASPLAAQRVPAGTIPADTLATDTITADTMVRDTAPAASAPGPVGAFVRDLADPGQAISALALGLYDHARTEPGEWGGGADALARRIASRAGGHVVATSVRHGLSAALGRSTEYEACECPTPGEKVTHVFVETFTDRDRTGRRVFSEPFVAGTYAGALAPILWHPDAEVMDGLQSGTLSMLFTVAGRVIFALLEPLAQNR
jgi:hypothetical protein